MKYYCRRYSFEFFSLSFLFYSAVTLFQYNDLFAKKKINKMYSNAMNEKMAVVSLKREQKNRIESNRIVVLVGGGGDGNKWLSDYFLRFFFVFGCAIRMVQIVSGIQTMSK